MSFVILNILIRFDGIANKSEFLKGFSLNKLLLHIASYEPGFFHTIVVTVILELEGFYVRQLLSKPLIVVLFMR